jgi:CheY-like chemotaxis protein
MGGKIWLKSELGMGSTFSFTVLLKRGEHEDAESFRDADKAAEQQVTFHGRRLLMAEDVEINREIVQSILEPTEIDIDCAINGVEALRMFSEDPEKYDLILMDLQMPEMDGFEATRKIRALEEEMRNSGKQLSERPEGVPIIAMTANVFKEDIEKCLQTGMNDHIGKPLDFNEVMEKLKLYLQP